MEKVAHHGQNLKRIREILGIKQEALAISLGEDWNQKKISLLEQKEIIEESLLNQVAKAINVTPEAIRNFNENAAVNIISNTFNDEAVAYCYHYKCNFNPVDKIVELYTELVNSEKEKVAMLQSMLAKGN